MIEEINSRVTVRVNQLKYVLRFQLSQTELVLKVFLRLVEDVLTFQNVSPIRRKEILSSLTANTIELFDWFILLLRTHSTKAEALVSPKHVIRYG